MEILLDHTTGHCVHAMETPIIPTMSNPLHTTEIMVSPTMDCHPILIIGSLLVLTEGIPLPVVVSAVRTTEILLLRMDLVMADGFLTLGDLLPSMESNLFLVSVVKITRSLFRNVFVNIW